ncbi:MAG TPA: DUF1643 domain-containing protein [Candidatus Krumholzibacteria bacterium]
MCTVKYEACGTVRDDIERFAIFGDNRRYRYVLRRRFLPDSGKPLRLCVWLNPSKADEKEDDASVRVGMGFARRWGDGGIVIINVGDLVETYSTHLPALHEDRRGPEHWPHVFDAMDGRYGAIHADVLCGWGDEGAGPIAEQTVAFIRGRNLRPVALALTKSGNPGHPLRKSYDLVPIAFETPQERREAWARAVKQTRARGAP